MRTLALAYVGFVLAIVIAADLGALGPLVRGLHAIPLGDKLCHLALATGLGVAAMSFPEGPTISLGVVRVPSTLVFVAVVVVIEEASQRFIAGRTFDLLDLAADFIGLGIGTSLAIRRRSLLRDH